MRNKKKTAGCILCLCVALAFLSSCGNSIHADAGAFGGGGAAARVSGDSDSASSVSSADSSEDNFSSGNTDNSVIAGVEAAGKEDDQYISDEEIYNAYIESILDGCKYNSQGVPYQDDDDNFRTWYLKYYTGDINGDGREELAIQTQSVNGGAADDTPAGIGWLGVYGISDDSSVELLYGFLSLALSNREFRFLNNGVIVSKNKSGSVALYNPDPDFQKIYDMSSNNYLSLEERNDGSGYDAAIVDGYGAYGPHLVSYSDYHTNIAPLLEAPGANISVHFFNRRNNPDGFGSVGSSTLPSEAAEMYLQELSRNRSAVKDAEESKAALNSSGTMGNYSVSFADITGDNIPEMIYAYTDSSDKSVYCRIISFRDGQLHELKSSNESLLMLSSALPNGARKILFTDRDNNLYIKTGTIAGYTYDHLSKIEIFGDTLDINQSVEIGSRNAGPELVLIDGQESEDRGYALEIFSDALNQVSQVLMGPLEFYWIQGNNFERDFSIYDSAMDYDTAVEYLEDRS